MDNQHSGSRQRIVVIGGGFAGVKAVRKLASTGAQITLIDKNNYSLFQPFLYQVATSILSGEQIGVPLRTLFKNDRNVEILMGEVQGIDLIKNEVNLAFAKIPFDYLVVASGVRYNYFGKDEWKKFAPSLKSVEDADYLRKKILGSFEKAEIEHNQDVVQELMTFVMVGGGPTGVEMAGTLAELTKVGMLKDFRHIDPAKSRIVIVEANSQILHGFAPSLGENARKFLEKRGVEIRTGARVTHIDETGISIGSEKIAARNVIWTAGVEVPLLGQWLESPTDKSGRIKVQKDLSVPGHSHIFVAGDAAYFEKDGKSLPGVAQVALQQGSHVAKVIRAKMKGDSTPHQFHYFDKGNMAIVGKMYAVADLPKLKFSGLFAFLIWALVHIFYNFNLKNRISVVFNWIWTFFSKTTTVRLLSGSTNPFPDSSSATTPEKHPTRSIPA